MWVTAILDIIDVPTDGICFIVMEEWSSHLFPELPYRLRDFLSTIHQCIEVTSLPEFGSVVAHVVFLQAHRFYAPKSHGALRHIST